MPKTQFCQPAGPKIKRHLQVGVQTSDRDLIAADGQNDLGDLAMKELTSSGRSLQERDPTRLLADDCKEVSKVFLDFRRVLGDQLTSHECPSTGRDFACFLEIVLPEVRDARHDERAFLPRDPACREVALQQMNPDGDLRRGVERRVFDDGGMESVGLVRDPADSATDDDSDFFVVTDQSPRPCAYV